MADVLGLTGTNANKMSFQISVRTETDGFESYLIGFVRSAAGHLSRSRQSGIEITDSLDMHFFSLTQRLAENLRQVVEHILYITHSQRTVIMNLVTKHIRIHLTIHKDTGMQRCLSFFRRCVRIFIPIKHNSHYFLSIKMCNFIIGRL